MRFGLLIQNAGDMDEVEGKRGGEGRAWRPAEMLAMTTGGPLRPLGLHVLRERQLREREGGKEKKRRGRQQRGCWLVAAW